MVEAVHSFSSFWRARRFQSLSPTMAWALRLGVSASAAIWIGNASGLADNHSSWILITVCVLAQPTAGASLMKSLFRAMGTLAAAISAISLFGLFSQNPPLLMAGFFSVQAVSAYFYLGSRFQYAWYVWGFTTAIILGDAMSSPLPVETVAFQRASMVAIGIVVVFVVDSLFATERSEPQLRKSLALRALQIGDRLRRAIGDSPLDPAHSVQRLPAESSGGASVQDAVSLDTDPSPLIDQLALVDAARTELGVSRNTANMLANLAIQLEVVASLTRRLSSSPESAESGLGTRSDAQNEMARQIGIALQEIAASVRADRIAMPSSGNLERALLAIEAERDRNVGQTDPSPSQEGQLGELRDVVAVLIAVGSTLSSPKPLPEPTSSRPFWLVRPDPFRVKIGIRTGIAVILAFLVPVSLGWPMNIVVAPVAFMTASARTRGALLETALGLSAVIALAWLVADLAIVYFMPHLARVPIALVVPFAVGAGFAAISVGRPLLATLPSVGGIVALTSVFGEMDPPTDVYGSYSLVCYMGVAIIIGSLCNRTIWSTTVTGLFRRHIVARFEESLNTVRLTGKSGVDREQSTMSGVGERDRRAVDLIRVYAEQSASPSAPHDQVEGGLDLSRQIRIRVLSRDLMDAVIGDQRSDSEASWALNAGESMRSLLDALRHEREALIESMQTSIDLMQGDSPHRTLDLSAARQVVNECLNLVQRDSNGLANLDHEQTRRFLAKLDARDKLVFCQRAIEDWFRDWAGAEAA